MKLALDTIIYAVVVVWDYHNDEEGKYDAGIEGVLHLTTSKEQARALRKKERKTRDKKTGPHSKEYVDIEKMEPGKREFYSE